METMTKLLIDITDVFTTLVHYLVHPFESHRALMDKEDDSLMRLSSYEALGASWVFVVFNAIMRLILMNFVLVFLLTLVKDMDIGLGDYFSHSDHTGYYFIVFSTVLDVIFYPLFGFFIIQFWDGIIKFYAKALGDTCDITNRSNSILAVSFSSQVLLLIPIFGKMAQSLSVIVLMYAGLRVQLKASPVLSVCILLTPFLFLLGALCFGVMIGVLFS